MADRTVEECIEEQLRRFSIYDQSVDVVSSFETLFTQAEELIPTVTHFERYPRIPKGDGDQLKPDFTVVFNDGTGLAGEVSRLSLHPNSAEKLALQVANYDALRTLPMAGGGLTDVEYCDVLLIVPMDVANGAFSALRNRLSDDDHAYAPSVPPCLVQYSFHSDKYVFQRWPAPGNGELREQGRVLNNDGLPRGIGAWMDRDAIKVPPSFFAATKTRHAFMNDPIIDLYLATHLWTKTFPELAGGTPAGSRVKLEVSETGLADDLAQRYGVVRKNDVQKAMDLLKRAKLADRAAPTDAWIVAFHELAKGRNEETQHVLARRLCTPSSSNEVERMLAAQRPAVVRRPHNQGSLFDGAATEDDL